MLNPVGRPGIAVITPLLKPNDESAAAANWTQLKNMLENARRFNGAVTIELPPGLFYVGTTGKPMIVIDERSAGLTIKGMGSSKTILVPSGETGLVPFSFISSRVGYFSTGTVAAPPDNFITGVTDATNYQEDDVVYIWTENSGNGRSTSHRRVVTNVNPTTQVITLSGTNPSVSSPIRFKHVKGIALLNNIPAGSNTVRLADDSLASRLTVGDDVLIGDGPALNNFYSEWAKIVSIDEESSPVVVTLDRRLRRDYAVGSGFEACIVPGPHMSDITIRDLAVAMPSGTPTDGLGLIRFGLRTRFQNVEFVARPSSSPTYFPVNVVNCGDSAFGRASGSAILKAWATQDLHVEESTVAGVNCREFSSDLLFDGITTYRPEGFQCASATGPGPCERIHLVNSRITNHGNGSSASNVNFVKGSVISNVQIVQPNHSGTPPAIDLEDDDIVLTSVTSESELSFSGSNERVENLTAPHLTLDYGSSGILLTPLLPDPTEISDDAFPPGAWRAPLRTRLDGKVAGTATTDVSLEVIATETQTGDLQQWQDDAGDPLLKIRVDGNLASANIEEATVPESQRHRLPIYDEDDNLVGYIPIHAET